MGKPSFLDHIIRTCWLVGCC